MPSLVWRSARDKGKLWIFGSFFDFRKRNQGFILQQKNSWMCILGYSLIFMWFLFCFFLTNKSNVNCDHVFCGISRCWSTEPFAMNQVPRYSSLTLNTSLSIAVNNVVIMTNLMLKMKVIAAHQILLLKFVACLWHNLMFINVQKLSGSPGEMALVVFSSHGPHAGESTTFQILAFLNSCFLTAKVSFLWDICRVLNPAKWVDLKHGCILQVAVSYFICGWGIWWSCYCWGPSWSSHGNGSWSFVLCFEIWVYITCCLQAWKFQVPWFLHSCTIVTTIKLDVVLLSSVV